jgi:hypothetical protein
LGGIMASEAGIGASMRMRLTISAPEKLVMSFEPSSTSMLRTVAGIYLVFVS